MDDLIQRFRKGVTLKEAELEHMYRDASDAYYNTGDQVLADDEFDALKARLKAANPKNAALAIVGAPVRDATRKVKLPYWMGSLDKIRDDAKAVNKWKAKYAGDVVVSDKLDGNSALFSRNAQGETALYSRGDGVFGQDCSGILKFIKGIPKNLTSAVAVRGEVIFTRKAWAGLKDKGANARNVAAGIMNSKTYDAAHTAIAREMEFVAYELLGVSNQPPAEGLKWMHDFGFVVVPHSVWTSENLTMDKLSTELVARRKNSPYEVDGIVIFHNVGGHKAIVGKNPKHAFAFKSVVTHDEAEVIVVNVEWNVSKDGYMKPTVIFEPVSLNGVVIRRATGFNANFIKTNAIGVGAKVVIIRSGDVIPKIMRVVTPAPGGAAMPAEGTWEWVGASGDPQVDIRAVAGNVVADAAAAVSAMEHFAKTMELEFVGRGTLERLAASGVTSVNSLMRLDAGALNKLDGIGPKNAERIAASIAAVKKRGTCDKWMVASNLFGRGVGNSKIKAILDVYPEVLTGKVPTDERKIEGVGKKTLDQFFEGLPAFMALMKDIGVTCIGAGAKLQKTSPVASASATAKNKSTWATGQTIVFTGFRNKEWEALVEANNGQMAAGITKKTTLVVAKDPNEDSTKLKKARESGIKIIGMNDFEALSSQH